MLLVFKNSRNSAAGDIVGQSFFFLVVFSHIGGWKACGGEGLDFSLSTTSSSGTKESHIHDRGSIQPHKSHGFPLSSGGCVVICSIFTTSMHPCPATFSVMLLVSCLSGRNNNVKNAQ